VVLQFAKTRQEGQEEPESEADQERLGSQPPVHHG